MGRNSRQHHKAKRKAARAQRREPAGAPGPTGIPHQRQIADELIDQAVHAIHLGQAQELTRLRRLLADGPGGAVGEQLVNRALFTSLLHDVEQTWKCGWQPAELARLARRSYTARHSQLLVDAIAAQMRVYAAAAVDTRWSAQTEALGAHVWWEHDDHYVDRWAEVQGVDRVTAIEHLLDLLRMLRTLPPIEPVCPMPGVTAPGRSGDVDQRMLDKVRALLAKAESTDFPHEAEVFTAKAQQLMARYSIDRALLAAGGSGRDEPATRRIAIDNPYEAPKTLLLQVVAEANRCRAVWMKRYGLTSVVGYPADLDATELLFTSLLVQATRAMTQAGARKDRYGANTTRSFRQSFLTAYAQRIGERLNAATQEVGREAAESAGGINLLPVLAARSDAVQDLFERQFPELTGHATRVSNREGWVSGRSAADQASLHDRLAVSR